MEGVFSVMHPANRRWGPAGLEDVTGPDEYEPGTLKTVKPQTPPKLRPPSLDVEHVERFFWEMEHPNFDPNWFHWTSLGNEISARVDQNEAFVQ